MNNEDGAMRFTDNNTKNPDACYEPNGFGGPKQDPTVTASPLRISGDADRGSHREGNDNYTQQGNLFRLMDARQRERLCSNIAAAMNRVPDFILERQLGHFDKADPAYGAGVRAALAKAGHHVAEAVGIN
jgi:catalase